MQTTNSDGVIVDKTQSNSNGAVITPAGDLATVHKSTETTTVH